MDPFKSRRQRRIDRDAMTRDDRRDWVVWGTGDRTRLFDDYWQHPCSAFDTDVVDLIVELDPTWVPAPDDDEDGGGPWMVVVRAATEAEVVAELDGHLGRDVRGFRRLELPEHAPLPWAVGG